LILLHGYTQTSRMWRPLIDKLKDKFTVIAPDLPGIGDSDIPKDGCDMKTAAISHSCAREIDRRYEGPCCRPRHRPNGCIRLCRTVLRRSREARRYGRFPPRCAGMGARV